MELDLPQRCSLAPVWHSSCNKASSLSRPEAWHGLGGVVVKVSGVGWVGCEQLGAVTGAA